MMKLHLVNMLFAALLVILPDTYAAPQAGSILSVLQDQKQTNTPALTSSEPNKRSKRSEYEYDGYLPYIYPTDGELPHVHPHIHSHLYPNPHLQLPHLNLRKHPRIQLRKRKHKHPRFPIRQDQQETHLPPPPPSLRPPLQPPTDFDMSLNIGNIFAGLLGGLLGVLGH